jgi:hypothetical protein
MQDMLDALRTLPRAVTPGPAGPDVAAADVARGHRALSRKRHRRIAFSGAALAVAAVVGVVVGAPVRVGSTTHPTAASPGATTQVTKVQLEAYTGAQPTGFTVSTVPAGWQVISSDRYSFVVAPPAAVSQRDGSGGGQAGQQAADQQHGNAAQRQQQGTASQTNPAVGAQGVSFVGRIAVMLQGQSTMPSQSPVTKVSINGQEGLLGLAEGGTGSARSMWLIFPYGQDHEILVQVPLSLGLTDKQIVSFARGITVTSAAQASNG